MLVKKYRTASISALEQRLKSSARWSCGSMPVLATCVNRALLQTLSAKKATKKQAAVLVLPRPGNLPAVRMLLSLHDPDAQIAIVRTAVHKVCLSAEMQSCIICSKKEPSKSMTCTQCWSLVCYTCTVKIMQHSASHGALACPLCRKQVGIMDLVPAFMLQSASMCHRGPYVALYSVLKDCKPKKLIVLQPHAPTNRVYETVVSLSAHRTVSIPTAAVDIVNRLLYGQRCLMIIGESSEFSSGYFVEPLVHAFFVENGQQAHDVSQVSDLLHILRMAMLDSV